jgi:hypothetical protein
MGTVKHHTIIVTSYDERQLHKVQQKAKEIYGKHLPSITYSPKSGCTLVSEIIQGIVNSQDTFFIAPHGSKLGWYEANNAEKAESEFIDWLENSPNHTSCEYVAVEFGRNCDEEMITNSTKMNTKKCDVCEDTFTGNHFKVVDENHKPRMNMFQCKSCFSRSIVD